MTVGAACYVCRADVHVLDILQPAEATLLAPGKEGARRPGVAVADGFIGTFGDNPPKCASTTARFVLEIP